MKNFIFQNNIIQFHDIFLSYLENFDIVIMLFMIVINILKYINIYLYIKFYIKSGINDIELTLRIWKTLKH